MTTQYYVTANGPVTFNVAGRSFSLKPGESKGAFNKQELDQILNGVDKSRLHVVAHESSTPAPAVEPQRVPDQLHYKAQPFSEKDEQYKGVVNETLPTSGEKDVFAENAKESVNLTPPRYEGTASVVVETKDYSPIPQGEERPPLPTSHSEVIATFPEKAPELAPNVPADSGIPLPVGAAKDSNPDFATVPPVEVKEPVVVEEARAEVKAEEPIATPVTKTSTKKNGTTPATPPVAPTP